MSNNRLMMDRREFIKKSKALGSASLMAALAAAPARAEISWTPARYFETLEDDLVRCTLCPRGCIVPPGERGHCDVRANRKGSYYSLVYGQIASYHRDPIEKKPFFHVMPASLAFSIATAGCNVDCKFCQNWELAQRKPEDLYSTYYTPQQIVQTAGKYHCRSIAYTYNEPTIFTEYILDTAALGREAGIKSVVVSNGYIERAPLKDLSKVVDAYKIDLKAFTESYYRDIVGGRLAPVLDSLQLLKEENVWTEIVYLMVPTLNDDPKSLKEMSQWIMRELGPDVPLHFSRFYPKYKLKNLPPTPVSTMETARQIALDSGLHFVYLGNVPGHEGENTYCPHCGKLLIQRIGYRLQQNHVTNGVCTFCGGAIPGLWE